MIDRIERKTVACNKLLRKPDGMMGPLPRLGPVQVCQHHFIGSFACVAETLNAASESEPQENAFLETAQPLGTRWQPTADTWMVSAR